MELSIVTPVYKAEKIIYKLIEAIKENAYKCVGNDFEIILVNDSSPDMSWLEIEKCCKQDKRVKALDLSRNFGQHYAISAGLSKASGKYIIVMDCDFQDDPNEMQKLFEQAKKGYDIVVAQRTIRHDKFIKKMSSIIFYKLFHLVSGIKIDQTAANYGVYSQKVIDAFNQMPEKTRSFGMLINYLGFKRISIPINHRQRAEGKSSYSIKKLLNLALDIIVANSNRPLHIAVAIGFIMSILSFCFAFYNIIAKCLGFITLSGFTTTIFSIWFVGGLILAFLGITSIYIGKIFDQTKNRPLFIVREQLNF